MTNWDDFRAQFPVTRRWAFLDHAAVAPLPAPAVAALREYADNLADNGIAAVGRWTRRIQEVRALAARLLNANAEEVAFIKNTSDGINFVAEGFPWQRGDNVVLAAEEYPSNQYPWLNQAHRGVEVRAVPSRGSRIAIDDIRDAIDSRTRIVSMSYVEYASGFRNDLDVIGALCRERGVYFFVDAIQGLGVFPLDVRAAPIDFLAADSHKWLLGPEGIGIFWVRRELIEMLHPIGVGWNSVVDCYNFSTIDFRLKPGADRWEGGAPNVAGIHAMGASLELLLATGVPALERRVMELTDHLCDRAAKVGLGVFSSRDAGEASSIVSLLTPRRDPAELMRRCRDAGVIINQRAGRLRASPHAYNTVEEIDKFLEVVRGCSGAPMPDRPSQRIAVCTGTFDPVHLGHVDIIERGCRMFDELVVGVGPNPDKEPFFSAAERVALLEDVVRPMPNVRVMEFEGLAVKFVRSLGARVMLRGLRTLSDMEYEFSMSLMNLNLDPGLETIFLMAREEYSHVSSTLLRQIAQFGGDLSKFLPPSVRRALEQRARERNGG